MTDNVPMVLGSIELIEPSHFDGWSPEDLTEWVVVTAPRVHQAEEQVKAARDGIGLAIWNLRQTHADGPYGEALVDMANRSGVSVRTLNRWRQGAEDRYNLVQTRKAVGQSERQLLTVGTRVPKAIPPPKPKARPVTEPPTEVVQEPSPAMEPCVRCANCPRCGGTNLVPVVERRPFASQ